MNADTVKAIGIRRGVGQRIGVAIAGERRGRRGPIRDRCGQASGICVIKSIGKAAIGGGKINRVRATGANEGDNLWHWWRNRQRVKSHNAT